MRFLSDVLGAGSKGGGRRMDGKGVDFSSSRSHPSVIAKVPCLPVQHRKSEQGSVFQAPRHFSPLPLLTMWKAGVSLSERQSQQKPAVLGPQQPLETTAAGGACALELLITSFHSLRPPRPPGPS